MTTLAQLVLNGVITGAVLMLAALGLTLVFRISRFANVAHAELITFGGYMAYWSSTSLQFPQAAALPLAAVATAVVGLIGFRFVFGPLSRRLPLALVIASIGVGMFLQNLIIFVWGSDLRPYPIAPQRALTWAGLKATPTELVILAVALALMLLVHGLLQHTRLGKEMRAVADSPDLARVTGIRPEGITAWMWVLASALAAIAGALLAMKTVVSPYMGWNLLLPAFAAAILGGIGNPYGAMAGGVLMGVTEEVATRFMTPSYRPAVAFTIMTLALLVRPRGLFGERGSP